MTEILVDIITLVLILLGAAFSLLAAVGLIRMPDVYMRMQSATKAGTLGLACTALAAAVHFGTAAVAMEAALVIIFAFATAPIASHLIGRAAWVVGVPMWHQTGRDDLSDLGHLGRLEDNRSATFDDGRKTTGRRSEIDFDGEAIDPPVSMPNPP